MPQSPFFEKIMKTKQLAKKQTIAVGINSLMAAQQPAYSNHIQAFFRFGRSMQNYNFCLINPPRMSIDRMRNMAAEVVLSQEFEYLLFLDDDVLIPFDGLIKLLDVDADIVAGDVMIRGYPFNHMAFRYTKDKLGLLPIKDWKKKDPLHAPVDAVGFSFCLIKASVLKTLEKPYFVTGPTNTEDIYFCMKARQVNPKLKIAVHRGVVCQHILWPELIGPDNVLRYREYYEKYYGKPTEDKEKQFRGKNYLHIVKGALDA